MKSPLNITVGTIVALACSGTPRDRPELASRESVISPDPHMSTAPREYPCSIIILKSKRELRLYCKEELKYIFPIELGFNPLGDKIKQGDGATPEGNYHIGVVKQASPFYKSFVLDYPNEQDQREFAQLREQGLVSLEDSIGGSIAIHGLGGRSRDWTLGCVAIQDQHMDLLFEYVRNKSIGADTPVLIVP